MTALFVLTAICSLFFAGVFAGGNNAAAFGWALAALLAGLLAVCIAVLNVREERHAKLVETYQRVIARAVDAGFAAAAWKDEEGETP